MNALDLAVVVIYIIGLLGIAGIFIRMGNKKEMFVAGGQSPWWVSGLSSFMTTFSAGSFVVWGGIAYMYGLVGVSILSVIGISAFIVGKFLADRWKSFGYDSAPEFIEARFGQPLVQFYTWVQGIYLIFTIGGTVYALSVVVCALIPLPEGHILADPETGNFSVTLASLIISVVVIAIATGGGLWAVLMTDGLQFIILTVSVIFVIPLIFIEIGGINEFVTSAPEGFFSPTAAEYTWLFLAGWMVVFIFKLGGEWSYVQRFACVPEGNDAKKSYYLFGVLYIICPVFWMLPPMAFRIMEPNANYEEAYILASEAVLPAGMVGLMVAAMISATASMATTQLNVFAGAFTTELYQKIFRPRAYGKELVVVGRIITLVLGGIVIAGALLIPHLGSYTGYILGATAMLTGPIVLPPIWGLFSKKIGLGTAFSVTIISIVAGLFFRFGFREGGMIDETGILSGIAQLLQGNERITEIVMGTLFPLTLLSLSEFFIKNQHPGWLKVASASDRYRTEVVKPKASTLPAKLFGWSILILAVIMAVIAVINDQETAIIAIFALVLLAVGSGILWFIYFYKQENNPE